MGFTFNTFILFNAFSQIASVWSGVSSVHVDDFLGCGTNQMLLLFKDQGVARQPLEKFLLTDLCGICYSVSPNLLICHEPQHATSLSHGIIQFLISRD